MTLTLMPPITNHVDFTPQIAVVGVGGGGTNAVDNMVAMGLEGVEFLVANTDAQSLMLSTVSKRIQLGPHLTGGLGAGAKPEIGRAAAEEVSEDLSRLFEGRHMVFVCCGLGGGTGTGAAPVVASLARERGALTVGFVTLPFDFEGPKRRRAAEAGLAELQQAVDTLVVIPNQNLFHRATASTTFAEAFRLADEVLHDGIRGITDLMTQPGTVNLDFADIRTVMSVTGKAMMGTGEADGEGRALRAADAAISNPLLEEASLKTCCGLLVNITGGRDMTLYEIDEAMTRVRKGLDDDTLLIFGSTENPLMNGRIRVSVLATGIGLSLEEKSPPSLAGAPGTPVAEQPPRTGSSASPPFVPPSPPPYAPGVTLKGEQPNGARRWPLFSKAERQGAVPPTDDTPLPPFPMNALRAPAKAEEPPPEPDLPVPTFLRRQRN
jgi:cell division protein FtsZ